MSDITNEAREHADGRALPKQYLADLLTRLADRLDESQATNRNLNRRIGELERALRVAQGEAKMLRDTCPYKAELERLREGSP